MTIEEVNKLEEFFKNAEKQATPIYLNQATIINNYEHFLESHFTPLKIDPTSRVNQPLIWRLKALKLIVEANA
ncbi:DUF6965 family protein [Pedobacter mendelii]|uniref:DUF6965 domain-containing protein n=1 Tax=Pedobacter mendelii TaxID=1908240 RepID=A0ABQ2BPG4_9SPHI|nr:hypothetical protein [Pedobacter mendelii]GGI29109.1 hypothetical protein GCM10008119_35990 [Pedobacter mendelii]